MNKNWIEPTVPGERATDREAHIHQSTGGKSGGCAWKAIDLLGRSAACHGIVRVERFTLTVRQKSAAGVLVVQAMKAQTVRERQVGRRTR